MDLQELLLLIAALSDACSSTETVFVRLRAETAVALGKELRAMVGESIEARIAAQGRG